MDDIGLKYPYRFPKKNRYEIMFVSSLENIYPIPLFLHTRKLPTAEGNGSGFPKRWKEY
jgi:hypothetical protein